jgi:hypothetical protein
MRPHAPLTCTPLFSPIYLSPIQTDYPEPGESFPTRGHVEFARLANHIRMRLSKREPRLLSTPKDEAVDGLPRLALGDADLRNAR